MQEIDIRASSIASMIDCELRGASIALKLVEPLPSTPPSCIGSACHESTAKFDQAKLDGEKMTIDDAAGFAVDYIKNPPQEVDWGRFPLQEAIERALGVHTLYCADIAPRIMFEAVELPLDSLSFDFPDLDIRINLTGTLDRIYRYYSPVAMLTDQAIGKGVVDLKSGARACSQAPGKHKAQLGVYELLAENTLGESITYPAMIAALQTSADYSAETKIVERPRDALLGVDGQIGILEHLARMFKSGDFIGNPSSWLCSQNYCPLWKGCIFR